MRKLKSFRGKTRKKTGWVNFDDDFSLPIRTLSVAEELEFNFSQHIKLPTTQRRATAEEVEELKKNDPNFNAKIIPFVRVYDETSEEYSESIQEKEKLERIAVVAKYIDMDFPIEEEDGSVISLWEDFEVEKGDYYELAKFLAYEMSLSTLDLEKILIEVKALQGESVYEKLARFEQLTGHNMVKILEYVYEGAAKESTKMKTIAEAGLKAQEEAEKLNKEYKDEEGEL